MSFRASLRAEESHFGRVREILRYALNDATAPLNDAHSALVNDTYLCWASAALPWAVAWAGQEPQARAWAPASAGGVAARLLAELVRVVAEP